MTKYLFKVQRVTQVWTYVEATAETEDQAYERVLERLNDGKITFDVRNSSTVSFDINCHDVLENNV
jgi:UPF0288 family protein (methanogenesis marker protein 3)